MFNFNEVQIIKFFFLDRIFGVVSKKASSYSRLSTFSSTLSSRRFIVLQFTFRSMIHFELIFGKGVRSVSGFFVACGCPVVPAPFIEEIIFVSLYYSYPFNKDQLTIFTCVYLWGLYSIELFVYFFHQYHTVLITIAL